MSCAPLANRLENYTLTCPEEVLLVQITVAGEPDQILIFKGFSSSLMRPTAFDPEIPVLPEAAVVLSIDRLKGPYLPQSPDYIEQNIALQDFLVRLDQAGL